MQHGAKTDHEFPPLSQASPEGLLAIGGDLSPDRLIAAYSRGIFPWFNSDQPILWWSPDPRAVLFPAELHVSRSLRKTLKSGHFDFSMDRAFAEVIRGCAEIRTSKGEGTWISDEMIIAYSRLFSMGLAHSVEVWQQGALVGGLYGVAMGGVFFGESMFSVVPNASKCALAALAGKLLEENFTVIDCQVYSKHLATLGAREISRDEFVALLQQGLKVPLPCEHWHFDQRFLKAVS